MTAPKRLPAGKADLAPGQRRLVEIDGKSIGLFNVNGQYYALHNRCPHMAGPLCEGPFTGTAVATKPFEFIYDRAGQIVRCGWHGWEFDITTGQCLGDPRTRARRYPVEVEHDQLYVLIG